MTSVGGQGVGNFLDDITFGTGPCLLSTKTVTNLTRAGDAAEVGDVLRYTVTTRNDGGNPALQAVSTDALANGIDFVPGSLRIVSGPGAGALTDDAEDDRGEYGAAERTVRVRLGDAATGSAGGSIGVGSVTSYSFDARVSTGAAATTVENEARVAFRDAVAGQDRTSTTQTTATQVGPAADLEVMKVLDTVRVVAGEPVSYTITATNNGPQTGTGVTLTDTLPAGLEDVSAVGATCTTVGVTLTCGLPDLAVGGTETITIAGIASASIDPGGALTNTASIAGARTDPDTEDNTATASATVTTLADVSIVKTFAPGDPIAGAAVSYTLTVRNDGPSDARDVVITDPLDRATTFVDATINGEACAREDVTVLCPVGTLAPGATATATITVALAARATAVVQNTATVSTTTSDQDPENNAASVGFQPEVVADLVVAKTVSADAIEAGDPVSFTMTVSNDGPSDATDVVLTDALPAGFDVTGVEAADASCTTADASVRCTWDALAAHTSRTVVIHAVVAADAPAGTVTNTASVGAPAEDPDTTNNSDGVDVDVQQSADLEIAKVAATAPGVPGAPQSFVITVTNGGPSVARGMTVSDPLPGEFSEVGADHPGCGVLAGVLECAIGDLAPGASAEVTVSGTLAAGATGLLRNTATTTSATPDPDESDNTATAELPLAPSADVSLSKTTLTPEVPLGAAIEYIVTVRNDGPSAAAAAIVDETPDAGIRITEAVPSVGTWSADDARWTVGTLLPGDAVTLTVTAVADAEGTLTNTATAASATPDRDADDLADSAAILVTPVADLSIVKTASMNPAAVNGEVTYTLTVANAGPSDASNAVVTDTLPAELTDVTTTTAGCAITDGTFSCATASIAVDGVVEYRFTARIDPGTPATSVTNTAEVESATPDPDAENNSSTVQTQITGTPQVELVKAVGVPVDATGDGRIGAGDTVAYTFTVRNTGPTVLSDAVIDDPLLGGAIICAVLDGVTLAPGDEVSCAPVDHTLSQAALDAGLVRNVATVSAQSPRGPASDDASVAVVVPMANGISLAKSAGLFTDVDEDGSIGAGDTVDYTFHVRNTGTTTLSGAEITDPMLGGSLDCAALDGIELSPGQIVECGPFSYSLQQDDVDAGLVRNEAAVVASARQGEVRDTAQAVVAVAGTDAVELVKSPGAVTDADGDGRIGAGDRVAYSFTVRNAGTTTLSAVSITDPLLGGALECPALAGVPLLPAGTVDCGPLTYTLTQEDVDAGLVHNEASVQATGSSGAVSDEAFADVLIAGATQISLTKIADGIADATEDGRVGAGDRVDYRFTVRNTGTTVLTDVVIDDALLGGAVDCPALDGAVLQPGNEIRCDWAPYLLTQDDVDAQTVRNEASVTGQSRLGQAEDTAEVDVEVLGTNELSLQKSAGAIVDANGNGRTDAGDTIAYSFAVQNTGTTTVRGIRVSDPRLTDEVVCASTALAPGELTVCDASPTGLTQAEIDAGEIVNSATVTGEGPGETQVEAADSIVTPVAAQPAIALQKTGGDYADTDGDRAVSGGDTVRFRFVVTNTGAVTLTGVVIDDPKLGGVVDCDIQDLAPQESAGCGPVLYSLTSAEATAGSVTNAATVSAAAGAVTVTAADSVTVDVSGLAVTGGLLTMLPWAIVLLVAGLVALLIGRVRRTRSA